jgi:hypothetical protein
MKKIIILLLISYSVYASNFFKYKFLSIDTKRGISSIHLGYEVSTNSHLDLYVDIDNSPGIYYYYILHKKSSYKLFVNLGVSDLVNIMENRHGISGGLVLEYQPDFKDLPITFVAKLTSQHYDQYVSNVEVRFYLD